MKYTAAFNTLRHPHSQINPNTQNKENHALKGKKRPTSKQVSLRAVCECTASRNPATALLQSPKSHTYLGDLCFKCQIDLIYPRSFLWLLLLLTVALDNVKQVSLGFGVKLVCHSGADSADFIISCGFCAWSPPELGTKKTVLKLPPTVVTESAKVTRLEYTCKSQILQSESHNR